MTRALLILISAFQLLSLSAFGATLEWDPNTEPYCIGYRAYVGTSSQSYDRVIDVGTNTFWPIEGVAPGTNYFMAVTAYNPDGLESDFSEEVTYQPGWPRPSPPSGVRTAEMIAEQSLDLTTWEALSSLPFALTNRAAFFRVRIVSSP
jgi:hypothetical protein